MHTLSLMHTGWFVGKQVKIISIKQVCKVLEPATVVTKRTFLYSKKSNENFCEAVPDNIQMRRSQCINELCNYYVNSPNYIANEDPGVDSWPHHFIRASHVLENYLLLRHHKGAKTLMHRFAYIDPDRCEKSPPDSELAPQKSGHQHQPIEELSFMTQFAFTLKRAGYREVPQKVVMECLKKQHKYGNIELCVDFDQYLYARFWIYGRNELIVNNSESESLFNAMFSEEKIVKRIVHERVVVAARNRHSRNMILKGFKDVPVDHFESLLPEAKVQIPRERRWFLNISLTAAGIIAFFNVGMTMLTDFKLDLIWMLLLFVAFISFRSLAVYKSQRNKYMLAWKKMLYYKSTSNNAGLVMDTISKGHERSLKEALIVYGMALKLTQTESSVSQEEVTSSARTWLAGLNQTKPAENDFCSAGAFSLLERLGVFSQTTNDLSDTPTPRFLVQHPEQATYQLLAKVSTIATE